jgi:DNA repair protein REV1
MGSRLERNSNAVRKRIEDHTFPDEAGEEYEQSAFGGFGDYFRRKKIKLQNLDVELRQSSSKPQIFKGVVAHVSGYTQPPLHILHKQLVEHGAGFLQYLDSKTMATHIIASSLTPKKATEFSSYRIVKPAWVVDSIAAGRMLPWADYRVNDEGPRQKVLKFGEDGKIVSQTNTPERGYHNQIQSSFYTSQFKTTATAANKRSFPSSSASAQTPTPSKYTSSRFKAPETVEDEHGDDVLKDLETTEFSTSSPIPEEHPDIGADAAVTSMNADHPAAPASGPVEDEMVSHLPQEISHDSPTPASHSTTLTSEEHNAWLLSDPRLRKSSTANPEFLKQYYAESRLHHLSTWKAELKSKMQKLANEKSTGTAKPIKRRPGSRRYVMHVDFDSFFCAVSLKSAPEYVDKPAVVAHGTGMGSEIASCNYPARKFGVKNGMWMKRALELCSDLKVLPYDFPAYEEASKLFYEAILEVGGVVQSVSIDEALVDITTLVLGSSGSHGHGISEGSIWREQEKADQLASDLRRRIKERTGCQVSVGIGGNILLAKVALRKAKPAGQYQIKPEETLDFLAELKVEDLPGVAYSIGGKLEEIGIKLVKDIRAVSKERLVAVLGPKTGEKIWEYSRGIDRAEVGDVSIRKSVSAEVNWGIRFLNQPEAEEFVMNLSKELEKRLLNEGVKGTNLTMKIMRRALDAPLDPAKHLGHGKCDTFNKSTVFGVATHDAEKIGKEAVSILRSFKFSPGDLRGLGVQMQRLEPIKPSAAPEGSQKRLNFGAFANSAGSHSSKKPVAHVAPMGLDEISDAGSPAKSRTAAQQARPDASEDPISDNPLTPRKPKGLLIHPALALSRANEADAKANTPLNVMGTQFIMPSNPDPEVVAALPQDIRSRLMAQQPRRDPASAPSREGSPALHNTSGRQSRDQSPAVVGAQMPPDIDPEVFNALPDDMKAEVLAQYADRAGTAQGYPVSPQSPPRDRIIRPRPQRSPAKRGRGRGGIRGMLSRARERQRDAGAGLMQTNFVTVGNRSPALENVVEEMEELDQAFLAELPEEIRQEVMADHHRRKLAHKAELGLNLQGHERRHAANRATGTASSGQTTIAFLKPPAKVSFTATSLTSIKEVKDMLSAWYRETEKEGPHRADIEVFERYLARVVTEERDMEKAKKLIRWLDWLVEDGEDSKGRKVWMDAFAGVKNAVHRALEERGLGPMVL